MTRAWLVLLMACTLSAAPAASPPRAPLDHRAEWRVLLGSVGCDPANAEALAGMIAKCASRAPSASRDDHVVAEQLCHLARSRTDLGLTDAQLAQAVATLVAPATPMPREAEGTGQLQAHHEPTPPPVVFTTDDAEAYLRSLVPIGRGND